MTLGQIPGARFAAIEGRRGKGEAGAAIETYFGIPPNSVAAADFPAAGIELKSVPLVTTQSGLRVKERTVISMIDYFALAQEHWASASVRKKLQILFVYFEHFADRPKQEFPVRHVTSWQPTAEVEEQIRLDWTRARDKVLAGLAHELSESDGKILGPCTKSADSTVLREQPFSTIDAKPRAFALKPTFTLALFEATRATRVDTARLAELSNLDQLRLRYRHFEGRTIADVGRELNIPPSESKSYAAKVVRRAVGAASGTLISELERTLTVRISRVGADLSPYEALSFPAFRHHELIYEDWDDSDLLSRIEHMLIVPVHGSRRDTPQTDCLVGAPVYWEPTAIQVEAIRGEWLRFRGLIRAGGAGALPRESETVAIHVRPHGRDASDRDPTPGGGVQTRKSFWLNKRFVQEILRGS